MTGELPPRYRIARFDPDGSETTIARVGNIYTRGVRMAATPDGGLVFVLRGMTPLLRKIDASGAVVWDRLMDFTAIDTECRVANLARTAAIAVGPDGGIDVALESDIGDVLARYTAEGEFLSSHFVHNRRVYDLAAGPDGAVAFISAVDLIVTDPLDAASP